MALQARARLAPLREAAAVPAAGQAPSPAPLRAGGPARRVWVSQSYLVFSVFFSDWPRCGTVRDPAGLRRAWAGAGAKHFNKCCSCLHPGRTLQGVIHMLVWSAPPPPMTGFDPKKQPRFMNECMNDLRACSVGSSHGGVRLSWADTEGGFEPILQELRTGCLTSDSLNFSVLLFFYQNGNDNASVRTNWALCP